MALGLLGSGTVGCELLTSPFTAETGELVAFDSCSDLESYLKTQSLRTAGILESLGGGFDYNPTGFASGFTGTNGGGSGSANDVSRPHSTTNNQSAGVDEADIVQADSTHLFVLHRNQLVIIEAIGSTATDNDGGGQALTSGTSGSGQVVAEIDIPGNAVEMFLSGDSVLIVTKKSQSALALAYNNVPSRPNSSPAATVLVYDVSDRTAPELTREVAVDGEYMAARRIDNQIYIIARAMLGGPTQETDDEGVALLGDWLGLDSAGILGANLDEWLPYTYSTSYTGGVAGEQRVERASCTSTYQSGTARGDDTLGIVSFDWSNPQSDINTTTIIGDGSLVYASTDSIIVAMTNYNELTYGDPQEEDPDVAAMIEDELGIGGDLGIGGGDLDVDLSSGLEEEEAEPAGPTTYLHRFGLDSNGRAEYDATGQVPGYVLNQFSMDEKNGVVRVATYLDDGWSQTTNVFTLRAGASNVDDDIDIAALAATSSGVDRLGVMGSLRDVAPGESLHAVRFDGNIGYLVTFREVDPLWVVDLSNPSQPRIRGELMVPGFSTYVHPIEGERLLAIGMGGTWNDELKLSLFDVSNLDSPTALDEELAGGSGASSEALTEHRAFRYLSDRGLLAVPVVSSQTASLQLFRVTGNSVDWAARIDHEGPQVRRAYQIGDYLYSYSEAGVMATDLDTLQSPSFIDLD
jgi:uncharacterized secreted protein with C-terminal beta-propeller domain